MASVSERAGAPGGGPAVPADSLVEARGLVKTFDAVRALQGLTVTVPRGEITALVGDNGAGKSTLIRCLTGVDAPDAGEIVFDGSPIHLDSPARARRRGIETVYQDLALVEDLRVWQNLFLNRELRYGPLRLGLLDRRRMIEESRQILARLEVDVPSVRATVRRMSGGQRQCVAIARAVTWGRSLVIMDEPTAALGVRETHAVERLVLRLKERGVTVLIISHDLDQVLRIADGVWVLRRGRAVGYRRIAATGGDELVGLITGAIAGDGGATAPA
ncbi:ATP-binding cassette domain-containing protein [Phaeacidiphilus oryzae]|uniref:ATP-binding cassette domain-containing protein n=1 Tax=Phaeacidiphilus oryzae TaxID=348818 RepID=UPI00055C4E95|nr:ATP-binding cassette domain-containing protein [Phaeacidiphilus oryzae]